MAKTAFKPPKNLAQAADLWFTTRAQRLALDKQVADLKAQEEALRNHLIDNLPLSQATGIAGKAVRVSIVQKEKYQVDTENGGWDKLHSYILANAKKNPGVWSLMQKRLGETAVKELLDAGKKVPGITTYQYKDISYSQL